jgi:hypothetical protein
MRTSVDDSVDIIQVRQALQYTHCHASDDRDLNGANLFIYTVERSAVHVFHAYANVGIGEIRAVAVDDVPGVAFVHDLQLAHDLFAHTRLGIYEHDLGLGVN